MVNALLQFITTSDDDAFAGDLLHEQRKEYNMLAHLNNINECSPAAAFSTPSCSSSLVVMMTLLLASLRNATQITFVDAGQQLDSDV